LSIFDFSLGAQRGAEQLGDGDVAFGGSPGKGGCAIVGDHAGERAAGEQLPNNPYVAPPTGNDQRRVAVISRSLPGKLERR
jgi:hypothetical protein